MTSYTVVYAVEKKDKEIDKKIQKENMESNITFKDVNDTDWFYDSIIQVAKVNPDFMQMFADGLFRPQEYITFEEFLEWIGYSVMCLEDAEGKVDVPEMFGEWYLEEHNYFKDYMVDKVGLLYPENYGKNYDTGWRSKYSLAASSILENRDKYTDFRDINVKNSRGALKPNLTRKVMAEVLYDALKSEYNENNSKIKDYNLEELKYICNHINDTTLVDKKIFTVVNEGLMTVNNNKFNRTGYVTRAEAITALNRLINESVRIPTYIHIPDIYSPFDELPPVDLSYLYTYPTILDETLNEQNRKWKYGTKLLETTVNDYTNFMALMYNRDYTTINNNSEQYKKNLLYYLNGDKEYQGKEYSRLLKYQLEGSTPYWNESKGEYVQACSPAEGEHLEYVLQKDDWIENFLDKWVQDTMNNKVQVQAKFYTSEGLIHYVDGCPTLRGTLRIKYDNHNNPSNIKEELDLVQREEQARGQRIMNIDESKYDIYLDYEDIPNFEVGKWYEIDMDLVTIHDAWVHGIEERSFYSYGYIYPIAVRELK